MDDLSVLDYLKLKIQPKNWHRAILPDDSSPADSPNGEGAFSESSSGFLTKLADKISSEVDQTILPDSQIPLRFLLPAVLLAILAQLFIEPLVMQRERNPLIAGILYSVAAILLIIGIFFSRQGAHAEEQKPLASQSPAVESEQIFNTSVQKHWAFLSLACGLVAFVLFGNNQFNFVNLSFWFLTALFAIFAFYGPPAKSDISNWIKKFFRRLNPIQIRITPWTLACIVVFSICVWFRFYQLNDVPSDMFSDHAEKLYDVMDVLDGKAPIFFVRNTGREAFQFYWTALMIKIFGTGVSFLSLKIGTAFAGLFALPFVYLLGKKIGNRWVGLIAMFLMGTAYWPNVIGRVALRFAFYAMFTAPALYFLINGLAEKKRRDLILSGIFLGIGLQGYSAMRIVPILFVIIFLIYWITVPKHLKKNALKAFLALIVFAIIFCFPLLRITATFPDLVLYRSVTRLSGVETTIAGSPVAIFFSNLWNAILMPFWNNGEIWVHSIPYRPALETLSASFFFVGLVIFIAKIIRGKRWQDLSLLISIPFLMLPSILSIAFPKENPSLNRTAAAAIPIFIIVAYAIVSVFQTILCSFRKQKSIRLVSALAGILLIFWIGKNNAGLVFDEYRTNYDRNALNTREIGETIRSFTEIIGDSEDAFVIPFPHWVDTRLVGINAGYPRKDFALPRELIDDLQDNGQPMLFIYKENDLETKTILENRFPNNINRLISTENPDKGFYTFLVP